MDNKIDIIISRYNENLEWIENIDINYNIIIYNKGINDIKLNRECKIIPLSNIGREGHTFLYHIINNFNDLSFYTVFLQGYPFDHVKLSIILKKLNIIKKRKDIDFLFLNKELYLSDYTGNTPIKNQPKHRLWQVKPLPMIEIYNKIFTNKLDNNNVFFEFGAGAQFILSSKLIHKNNIDFFKNIITLFEKSQNLVDPIEGYCIERLWQYIFKINLQPMTLIDLYKSIYIVDINNIYIKYTFPNKLKTLIKLKQKLKNKLKN
jgi:hypothetical protein